MKNFSDNKKWERQVPKKINSDGYFSVGEVVLFNSLGSFYTGDLVFLKCHIAEIRQNRFKSCEYRIVIYLPNDRTEIFWASRNKLKKGKNIGLDNNILKFKPGQKVFLLYDKHYEATVVSAELGYSNDIQYNLQPTLPLTREFKVNEDYIRNRRNEVEDSKFKVGDFVTFAHSIGVSNRKNKVNGVFSYDDDGIVYYDLDGYNSGIVTDSWLIKCREPKIIFSNEDPYGEEDWGEEEF